MAREDAVMAVVPDGAPTANGIQPDLAEEVPDAVGPTKANQSSKRTEQKSSQYRAACKLGEVFQPGVVGGHNFTNCRATFDKDDQNIILISDRRLFYYNTETREEVGQTSLLAENLEEKEWITSCERLEDYLYVFTNHAKVFIWNMDTRDWHIQLNLKLDDDDERLIACKMLSKRQYVYTILNKETHKTHIYYSMSRSERERPKKRELFGAIAYGTCQTFDLGCLLIPQQNTKSNKQRGSDKLHLLSYFDSDHLYFQRLVAGEKLTLNLSHQRIQDAKFRCVRVNNKQPMVAAGDTSGRIYVYTGAFNHADTKSSSLNRTKLHWHSTPVQDLSFSSTGSTLFSCGGESGCIVVWNLTQNEIGQKRVIARLGMPIRYLSCGNKVQQLALIHEDNEVRIMDTNDCSESLKTLTKRTYAIYQRNDVKALRPSHKSDERMDMLVNDLAWHSQTDSVVTQSRTGCIQFYDVRKRVRLQTINLLKNFEMTLEKNSRVLPSALTKVTISLDGNWLAFYETRDTESTFPEVKLHIWQRSSVSGRWNWIQTADRMHSSVNVVDLTFSPDCQFLVSLNEDGTFHVLHQVSLDVSSNNKQMYAKGFVGRVPSGLASKATFSQDSSVMAISLTNDTTLIWMIVDPYKLVYECQLNHIPLPTTPPAPANKKTARRKKLAVEPTEEIEPCPSSGVIALQFGHHKATQNFAPLCEVRTNCIRIWNIFDQNELASYSLDQVRENDVEPDGFTAAAFDHKMTATSDEPLQLDDHLAVVTKSNKLMIFRCHLNCSVQVAMSPLIVVDASLSYTPISGRTFYTRMCFMNKPILEFDSQSNQDSRLVELLNRLCLMNNHQELVAVTDKLTVERQSAHNSCNSIKTYDLNELQAYFAKTKSNYDDEAQEFATAPQTGKKSSPAKNNITAAQLRIRNKLRVQRMLKELLVRVPTHFLPRMEVLGPLILDELQSG